MSTDRHSDPATPRIALVASERREFDGMLRRLGTGEKLAAPLRFAHCVRANGVEWILVADGQGAQAARRACAAIPSPESLTAIGSIGYCGATQSRWRIGDVMLAEFVRDRLTGEQYACDTSSAAETGLPSASILTVERVIRLASEKRRIGDDGVDAVDMEASTVARFAASCGLRFFALKAVSDIADEDLPVDFERARGMDGSIRIRSVMAQTLWRPWYGIPRLGKLARAASLASDNLGAALVALPF